MSLGLACVQRELRTEKSWRPVDQAASYNPVLVKDNEHAARRRSGIQGERVCLRREYEDGGRR